LDYYSRLVDALLEAGITPFVTCYHWDMPEATYRKHGGWHGRQTAHDMARYAGIVAKSLGDRVKNWFTVNEISIYTRLGYGNGVHAPGEKVDRRSLNQIIHHALLGHGLSVDAIRSAAPGKVKVGLAANPDISVPVIETPEHIAAAEQAMNVENGCYLVPIMRGAYDPAWWAKQGSDVPQVQNGDLEQISRPLDLVGLNLYSGCYKQSDGQGGYQDAPMAEDYPVYNIPWLRHVPDVMYWGLRWTHQALGIKELYISENGCCAIDAPNAKGEVLDVERVQYLRSYLRSAHRAISEGIPLRGYFLWSLLDNFEWAEGYSKRFGIYYTDFQTLERRPKLSAQWYAQVIRENRLL